MGSVVAGRLAERGIVLPEAAAPVANYVPFRLSGSQLFISGQVPVEGGTPKYLGIVGDQVEVAQAVQAARLCAINILAQASAALAGDLDRIVACIRLGIFVAATPAFTEHPKVANGASDLMVAVLGDAGRHARFAVGVASLPLGVSVEVDATFEIR